MANPREWLRPSFSGICAAAVLVYLLFPILIMLPVSFNSTTFLRFPPTSWSLRWYIEYFTDSDWLSATTLSLKLAVSSSVLAVIAGTLAAISLSRGTFWLRRPIELFITSPLIIPGIFVALGLFVIVLKVGWQGSELVVVLAHATISVPFVVLLVGAPLRQIDDTLERAARILGAGPTKAFTTAVLPGLYPAIFASAIIAFFNSFDELIIAQFVLSGEETLPMRIWASVRLDTNPTIAAVSSLLIILTTLAMVSAELVRRKSDAAN